MKRKYFVSPILLSVAVGATTPAWAQIQCRETLRVSQTNGGGDLSKQSTFEDMTPDGGYALFATDAPELNVDGKTRHYLYELASRKIIYATPPGNPDSVANASVSDDGRYVAFTAASASLPGGNKREVYRYDRQTGQVLWLSRQVPQRGTGVNYRNPLISGDGSTVYFSNFTSLGGYIYRYNIGALDDTLEQVVHSTCAWLYQINLKELDGAGNVLLFDGVMLLPGAQFPSFYAWAYQYDQDKVVHLSISLSGGFPNTGNNLATSVSRDGQQVFFSSASTDLIPGIPPDHKDRIFKYDVASGVVSLYPILNRHGVAPDNYVAQAFANDDASLLLFQSRDNELTPTDTTGNFSKVFLTEAGQVGNELVYVSSQGVQGNDLPGGVRMAISNTGRVIAYNGRADNLIANDGNDTQDVFLHLRDSANSWEANVAYKKGGAVYWDLPADSDACIQWIAKQDHTSLASEPPPGNWYHWYRPTPPQEQPFQAQTLYPKGSIVIDNVDGKRYIAKEDLPYSDNGWEPHIHWQKWRRL